MTILINGSTGCGELLFDFTKYSNRFEMSWRGIDLFDTCNQAILSDLSEIDSLLMERVNIVGNLFGGRRMESVQLIHSKSTSDSYDLNFAPNTEYLKIENCNLSNIMISTNIQNLIVENSEIMGAIVWENSRMCDIRNSKIRGNLRFKFFGTVTLSNTDWTIGNIGYDTNESYMNAGDSIIFTNVTTNIQSQFIMVFYIEFNGVTVENTEITYALFQFGSITLLKLKGCQFGNNKVSSNYNLLSLRSVGKLTIEECVIYNNTGSFLHVPSDPSTPLVEIEIRNSSFIDNKLFRKALIEIIDHDFYFSLRTKIENCTFIRNTGGVKGSAAYILGSVTVEYSEFSSNYAQHGGALYIEGSLQMSFSTLSNNQAEKGGAIYYNFDSISKTTSFLNNTCDNNLATYAGGCIYSNNSLEGISFTGENTALSYGNNIATELHSIDIWIDKNENFENIQVFPGESFKLHILIKDLRNQSTPLLIPPNHLEILSSHPWEGTTSQSYLFSNDSILVQIQIFPRFHGKPFTLSITVYPNIEKYVTVNISPCPNSYVLNESENGMVCEYIPFAVIIPSAVLGLISVCIIVVAMVVVVRKLLKLRKQEISEKEIEKKFKDRNFIFETEESPLLISDSSINTPSRGKSKISNQQQYIIPISDITILKRIGEGANGLVFHAKWNRTDVAIKQLKIDGKDEEFENEATLMSSLRHPCIVSCYGVSLTTNGKYMVVEYLENGSLEKAIYNSRIGKTILRFETKLKMLIDISKGMVYLHSNRIIHRDLKPGNLLLDKNMNVKIGDFGLSKMVSNSSASITTNVGTFLYIAPELLSNEHKGKSSKVDVYSFGIIMWEILFESSPFSDETGLTNIFHILKKVTEGHRPSIPFEISLLDENKRLNAWIEHNFEKKKIETIGKTKIIELLESYIGLMERCWNHQISERPEFMEIIDQLEILQSSM